MTSTAEKERLRRDPGLEIDAHERLCRQLCVLENVIVACETLGISDSLFVHGGVANSKTRDSRVQVDVDAIIQSKEDFDLLYRYLTEGQSKLFEPHRIKLLQGSGISFLKPTFCDQCGPLDLRYVVRKTVNNIPTWVYPSPKFFTLLMGNKPLIVPDAAFSLPEETWDIAGKSARFIRPEYTYLVKTRTGVPKDYCDASILAPQLDNSRIQAMIDQETDSGGIMILPSFLARIIRSFNIFELPAQTLNDFYR